LIALRRAPGHYLGADPMQTLNVLLLNALRRHKTHAGALQRFADGLGVRSVVLVRFHIRVAGDNYFFRWRQLKVPFLRPRYGIIDLHFSFSARFVRVRLFAASAR
jgi:hypothetical protein